MGPDSTFTGREDLIWLTQSVDLSRVVINSQGNYATGTPVAPGHAGFTNVINSSLTAGDKWFITLFEEFELPGLDADSPTTFDNSLKTGSILTPLADPGSGSTHLEYDSNGNLKEPLKSKGVYEIMGCYPE